MAKLKEFDRRADAIISDTSRSRSKATIIKKFDEEFNKWDDQFKELQLGCEKRCRKKKKWTTC